MTDPRLLSPAERMQAIALAAHRIADRFPAHEEGFSRRLKETAVGLIEDIAVLGVAKTRDAAGTNRLLHQILAKIEALKALFSFVKLRGHVPAATVDIVLWHVAQLTDYFQKEDAQLEHHIAAQHPHGAIVDGRFADHQTGRLEGQQIRAKENQFANLPFDKSTNPPANASPQARQAGLPTNRSAASFDPLLGPDSAPLPRPTATAASAATSFANSRQKRILDFFALNRRAQLKEVLALFPSISEKTVRNDLAQLCQQGSLRRVGLAPRSHYVLTA